MHIKRGMVVGTVILSESVVRELSVEYNDISASTAKGTPWADKGEAITAYA